MPFRKGGKPTLSASRVINPKAELLKTTPLTGTLGATAVRNSHISMLNPPAAHGDHLARAIERLYPIGLTKRRSDGSVVEGADNPLRSALPDPVGGPQRVETGVEHEYRVALGEITDGSRHRLRMDTILAARRIGLFVMCQAAGNALSHRWYPLTR